MKIGNYGTGGSYRYTTTGSSQLDQRNCRIFTCILAVITLGVWIYKEYDYAQQLFSINYVADNVEQNIPKGQEGVDFLQNYGNFDEKIVHLQNINITSQPVYDREFGFSFNNTLNVRRNVEYCQWQEIRHETKHPVGTDSNNQTIYEVEVSYSYLLGWHSHRINSLFFNSPVGYHNPQRNPVQSKHYGTKLSLGGSISMDSNHVKESPYTNNFWEKHYIPYNGEVSDYAYHNGFTRTSEGGKWIYSEYKEDYKILKGVASFLLEGVIDTGIKGTCTPGDIRVGWDLVNLPSSYSVVGQYSNNKILPVKAPNGYELIMGSGGSMSVSDLHTDYTSSIKSYRMYMRLVCLLITIVLFAIFYYNGGDKILNKEKDNIRVKDL